MKFHVMTYKEKPVTIGRMDAIIHGFTNHDPEDRKTYIISRTKKDAWAKFIYIYGFTPREWRKEGWAALAVENKEKNHGHI